MYSFCSTNPWFHSVAAAQSGGENGRRLHGTGYSAKSVKSGQLNA
jgi:hypothetical protein